MSWETRWERLRTDTFRMFSCLRQHAGVVQRSSPGVFRAHDMCTDSEPSWYVPGPCILLVKGMKLSDTLRLLIVGALFNFPRIIAELTVPPVTNQSLEHNSCTELARLGNLTYLIRRLLLKLHLQ